MIAVLLVASIALPAQWSAWQWSSPIGTSSDTMRQVTLPVQVLGNLQPALQDLRIIDKSASQVPYAILVHRGSEGVQWVDARVDDYGFVPGRYTVFVATVPAPKTDYTSLEFSTSAAKFSTTVDVLASDDRVSWREIKSGAPVFDFESEGLGSNTRVRIPPSHSRYYRVQIDDARAAFPIESVSFAQGSQAPPELMRYPAHLTVRNQPGRTIVTLDLGYAHVPVSLVRFTTSSSRFYRNAVLEASDDGANWTPIGSTTLERTPSRESRSMTFDESQGRYWRLRIANNSNTPLQEPRIEAWGSPRHVVFAATGGSTGYRLLYGNPNAPAPQYDFERIERPFALFEAARVSLGPEQANTSYAGPTVPWSESHRWVLWAVLAAVVLAIGGLAVRVLVTEGKQAA